MGRNYSFILVTDKENKKNIESFINADSDIKHDLDTVEYLSITFPKDSSLSAYLHDEFPDPSERKCFIKNGNKVSIASIMFRETVLANSNIARYEFMAVTNRMSDLFYMSSSVQNWFIELGKVSGALIVYFDIEYMDSILFSDHEKISVYFEDDYYKHIGSKRFCGTIIGCNGAWNS
jgi:hypothetical protein